MSQASIGKSESSHDGVPRGILRSAAILIGFALLTAGVARQTDVGTLHMPAANAVETLALRFEDRPDGSVAVRDAGDNSPIYVVQPGAYGFIRSTLRGLARERRRADFDATTPFTLTRWSDGTVSLEDATTKRRVNLDAFGPDNARAFAQLFDERRRQP
ncbi:photosynthetic complex assembly protein PuhC [Methylocystis echinoides]|uniref:Phosphonate-binding protein n=1 Tax=Methylocystis echinoides TaxID=29468 RepID=A0A9W6LTT4_9HYPH|nr:photosynthetic complex assembly protein PuhC [Methylocystis echinoides]GLI94836.1 phosphonate-binding protein [Methylocystis echinoides]